MIVIMPQGGLCNRMRALSSALELSEILEEKLCIIWWVNEEIGCRFEALFEKIDGVQVINIYHRFSPIRMFFKYSRKRYSNLEMKKMQEVGNASQLFQMPCYIETCYNFLNSQQYDSFEPIGAVREKIDKIMENFSGCVVGVHIRRTDNEKSIASSPTEAFFDIMDNEVKKQNDIMFYLATDDVSEEDLFIKRYGDKILYNKGKTFSKSSTAGMQDAVIDLYCLSHTNHIIGSYWSSFSDTAAALKGIPLMIIDKNR